MDNVDTRPVSKAFYDWANGELSSHYAAPCPDELMNFLVARAWADLDILAAIPAGSAEDLLLKIFPLLLATYEPKSADPPMVPVFGENNGCPDLLASVVEDLRRISPEIAKVMAVPNYRDRKRAA